ncbi:glucose-induced degradation protein 4 homolog [Tetranychus urticae]|uniref:Kinesin motor domain-containing protein n=1 Tax=Tetranychus urticae TaxID=32264 RepID=T1KGP5_TETUR|nr:glucose-induced degradation protein 4 homolog [Tetranychus urticae]
MSADINDAVCNIKVVCRLRPVNESEVKAESKYIVKYPTNTEDCVSIGGKVYVFDKVFKPNATQDTVYEETAKTIVKDVLMGYNASSKKLHLLGPPLLANSQMTGINSSLLYNGSRFAGHQKSKGNSYDVEVILQHVDKANSYLCGYLKIIGLTEEFPTMTTFFHGEIISKRYPFLTRKWEADEEVDKKHWSKFQPFAENFVNTFNSDNFDYAQLDNFDCMFMRWKEHFLVPDHTIKEINGASFAGFYYICFNKKTQLIEGYYYHRSSEMYQSLILKHVNETSTQVFEFR